MPKALLLWLAHNLLLSSLLCFQPGFCCSPPPPSPFGNGQREQRPSDGDISVPSRNPAQDNGIGTFSAFPGIEKASALSDPVGVPEELSCYDFDDKCRWRNMEGLLVDELDWYQGVGFLDENRLRLSTGTHLTPDGFYGIAATDKVEFAGAKAILVSDRIECQNGPANLRFNYWTSPGVKITVCVKSTLQLFPYFDYCSKPIENNDPGPAIVPLPEIAGSMQIFIQAHNFVYNSAALQGGFAIIDNLEYDGQLCERDGTGFDQFAAARAAPHQSAPRPDIQQPASQHQHSPPSTTFPPTKVTPLLVSNKEGQQSTGPYEGFRSLMEWMLYGNGLARQAKTLREMLNATGDGENGGVEWGKSGSRKSMANEGEEVEEKEEEEGHAGGRTATRVPSSLVPFSSIDSANNGQEMARGRHPEGTVVPGEALRSIRIVQRQPAMAEGAKEEAEGRHQIGPEEIRQSLLVNGQMPANSNLHIRRPTSQPHLELLLRRAREKMKRRRMEEAKREAGKEREELPEEERSEERKEKEEEEEEEEERAGRAAGDQWIGIDGKWVQRG